LYTLFLVEMWERFSFYVMNALFVLYMTSADNGHPFLQANASIIYGLYLGAVYFMPFPFGVWTDLQLGYRWAIILGAITMGLGHVLLAFDPLPFFFSGLVCLALGNGLFKPNISTLVGNLYGPNDPRLDNAYTIFYMGINLGAFLAPLIAGIVRVHYGFHWAFGIAGIGMAISLVLFLALQHTLVFDRRDKAEDVVLVPPQLQWNRHIALLIIFMIVALFWLGFKQNGNTFNLWFKNHTDRTAPSWLPGALLDEQGMITAEYVSSINPLFVLLFSPLLVLCWTNLRRVGLEPSTPAKIGLAMLLTAGAFFLMGAGGLLGGNTGVVSPGFILGAYAIITVAELCLSPIGLSLVSKLAAREQRSMWMGGWFAATAIGGYGSGLIGSYWKVWDKSTFFFVLAGSALVAFALLLVFYRRLLAAMPGQPPAPRDPSHANAPTAGNPRPADGIRR
jgi:POT family proton-dependent oligopeptide transporter